MKLPDKVYLNKFMIRPGMLYPAEFPPDNPEEEYIRKDALLEWARNMYEKTMTFVSGDIERDNEIQKFALRIVKHIESL